MSCKMEYCSLVVYVPDAHADIVKEALFLAGGGNIGNYSKCCWQTQGVGQFLPGEESSPYAGEKNRIEKQQECRIELLCPSDRMENIVNALKDAHPYETPAFHYWKVAIA